MPIRSEPSGTSWQGMLTAMEMLNGSGGVCGYAAWRSQAALRRLLNLVEEETNK